MNKRQHNLAGLSLKNDKWLSKQWGPVLAIGMCRMRMSEVLDLTDANELDNGLLIQRRKGSKTNITEWTPRLRETWEALKQKRNDILTDRKQPHPIHADKRFLIISERTGNKIDSSSMQTAMKRIQKQLKSRLKGTV